MFFLTIKLPYVLKDQNMKLSVGHSDSENYFIKVLVMKHISNENFKVHLMGL